MSDTVKARRAIVQIGSIEVQGFMLPDGSYRMSQTQAAECVEDDPVYARNFLQSRALQALRGEGYTPETFEVESTDQARGQTRIQGCYSQERDQIEILSISRESPLASRRSLCRWGGRRVVTTAHGRSIMAARAYAQENR